MPTSSDPSENSPPPLISQFLDQYESKQTRRAYRYDLEGFFEFLRESRPEESGKAKRQAHHPGRAERSDLLAFLRREAESVSRQTLRRRAGTLRTFFEWLVGEGHVGESPVAALDSTAALVDQALEETSNRPETSRPETSRPETSRPETTGPGRAASDFSEEKAPDGQSRAPEGSASGTSSAEASRGEPPPGNTSPEEGPDEEERVEETSLADDPQEEGASGEVSAGRERPAEIPELIRELLHYPIEEIKETLRLRGGEHLRLWAIPAALRRGLAEAADSVREAAFGRDSRKEAILRCIWWRTLSASVHVRVAPIRVGALIDDTRLSLLARDRRPMRSLPIDLIRYLYRRGWCLPDSLLELIGQAPHQGDQKESPAERPPPPDSTAPGAEVETASRARAPSLARAPEAFAETFRAKKREAERSPTMAWQLPDHPAVDRPRLDGPKAQAVFQTVAMEVVAPFTEGLGIDLNQEALLSLDRF